MAEIPESVKPPVKRPDIYYKIRYSFLRPSKLFEAAEKDKFLLPFLYYAILSLFYLVMLSVTYLYANDSLFPMLFRAFGLGIPASVVMLGVLSLWIVFLVFGFIASAIIHLLTTAFAKPKFSHTYKAFSYSLLPNFLLGWIPLVGPLLWIWALYLNIKGQSIFNKITTGKAALSVIVSYLIIIAILYLF